jgi:hypothetical protein
MTLKHCYHSAYKYLYKLTYLIIIISMRYRYIELSILGLKCLRNLPKIKEFKVEKYVF